MEKIKIFTILLVITGILLLFPGCSGNTDETTQGSNVYTAGIGNLSLDISAAGNLDLSHTEDLTADLFYQEGTVTEVLVQEGDSVVEGQVLVKIDPYEWQEQLRLLEDALESNQRQVETRERALANAERQVTNCEQALVTAQRNITTSEIQVREAEVNLEAAQYALDSMEKVQEVQDDIDYNESLLEFIDMKIIESQSPGSNPADILYWWDQRSRVEDLLETLNQEKNDILSGSSLNVSDTVALEVVRKQLAIEKAQVSLEDAQDALTEANLGVEDAKTALEDAKIDVEYAEQDLTDAEEDVEEASEALEEALSMSPEITAPFDGFVTKINVSGGDTVVKGTVLVQVADPDKFKADILVSEMDISQVAIGTSATVQIDALDNLVVTAKITDIAPTATIQSGVVNYAVTVELDSLEDMTANMNAGRQQMFGNLEEGELPAMLQQAVESGQMTQEEAEERWEQMQSGDFSTSEGFSPPEGMEIPEGMEMPEGGFGGFSGGSSSEGQLPSSMTITNIELRQGMTVTVSIVISEATDVLIVPNGAVSSEGGQYYVEVVSASGETEKRAVQIGISNWQYTEITEGLSEDEQVIVPEGTSTTTTEDRFQRPGGSVIIGGGF
jgi:multidrug efflux pump subunit AcrA (membrane-fusion protein)